MTSDRSGTTRVADALRWPWSDGRRADLSTAVLTFLAGGLLLGVGLVGVVADPPLDAPAGTHLVLLAVGCLLIAVKRRRPLMVLAGGVVLTAADLAAGGSLAVLLVLWDLLYSAILWTGRTARTVLWTAGVALTVVGAIAAGEAARDVRAFVGTAIQLGAVLLVPLWWAHTVRQKTELADLERARADEAAQAAALERERSAAQARLAEARRRDAVRAERAAMARDLHDVIAGHLSTIAIHSGAALANPEGTDGTDDPEGPESPDGSAARQRERIALEQVRASALASLTEMRAMIDLLRADTPDAVPSPGRLAELPALVETARAAGTDVTLTRAAPLDPAPGAAVEQALHRIAQEALTNARKHAADRPVHVRLDQDDDGRLRLEVRNPLRAAPAAGHPDRPEGDTVLHAGTGTSIMAERAAALGGTFHAGPEDDRWVVRAVVPPDPGTPPDSGDAHGHPA